MHRAITERVYINVRFMQNLWLIFIEDGIDTRIHGIKITSARERDSGLNMDMFSKENLVRFPKLENYEPSVLYRRATLLRRFVI